MRKWLRQPWHREAGLCRGERHGARRAGTMHQVGFQPPSTHCMGLGAAGMSQWGEEVGDPGL